MTAHSRRATLTLAAAAPHRHALRFSLLVLALVLLSVGNGHRPGQRSFKRRAAASRRWSAPYLGPYLLWAIAWPSVAVFYSTFWLTSVARPSACRPGASSWYPVGRLDKPTLWQAASGAAWARPFPSPAWALGYWWRLFDSNNQRYWHDYLSRTCLVLLPKTWCCLVTHIVTFSEYRNASIK